MNLERENKNLKPNKRGRPKGVPDVRSLHKYIGTEEGQKLINRVKEKALEGDMQAASILINKMYSTPKNVAPPVLFELDEKASLHEQASSILQACSNGIIDPDTAASLISSISNIARVFELSELEQRLKALEEVKNEA
jgi:hypothetical protein